MGLLSRYTHWLHTRWPSGGVEALPETDADGATQVPGLYVAGDLRGLPLLKFAAHSGARVIDHLARSPDFAKGGRDPDLLDVAILGAGVAGMAAALRCQSLGLRFQVVEAARPFATLVDFPKGKPIYTYPADFTPEGDVQFAPSADVKERLVEDMESLRKERGIHALIGRAEKVERLEKFLRVHLAGGQTLDARRVVVAIGRSGDFRKLGVPGEDSDKVFARLHDPADSQGKAVLVVGGGDSALEAAIALADAGASVTLCHRKGEWSRPKPENIARLREREGQGAIRAHLSSQVLRIEADAVVLRGPDGETRLPNDEVFVLIGREAPLDFFRRSGVAIQGEWTGQRRLGLAGFLAFCVWLYHWKGFGFTQAWVNPGAWLSGLHGAWDNPRHLLGVLKASYAQPWVWYTTAYAACVVAFGIRRIRRRRTPYVTRQTLTLTAIQVVPLFLLPCVLLPWAWHNGWFDGPIGQWIMGEFFPGGPGDFWRAFGLILAWPLMAWNVFTDEPMIGWLVISFLQTFVIIPLIVWRWGKGAYCGWICSCGALAETMGDAHRQKMPHGPGWNRLNMLGQAILAFAFVVLFARILGWIFPGSGFQTAYLSLSQKIPVLNYKYLVDLWLAGVLGVGLYFHFSGRVWCRFACPLAALMHIYARFSQFRILADKKKCISCNVCTSVCHQGIDVMSFANKGQPMADPQCVRCSACVQSCPTGVLSFGRIDPIRGDVLGIDKLPARPKV